jgi:hypothetical protein
LTAEEGEECSRQSLRQERVIQRFTEIR